MGDMGEPGFGHPEFSGQFDGLFQGEMGNMFLFAQCVQHQGLAAPDLFFLGFVDPVRIRDIGEFPETETQYRHFHMPDLYRDDRNIPYHKGFQRDRDHIQFGYARVPGIGKGIIKIPPYRLLGPGVRVDINGFAAEEIKGPDIVQPRKMVFMRMCKDHGIHVLYFLAKHLVPEIRTGIHY